jgi:hypothetical protein
MMGDLLYDLLTNPASQTLGLVFAAALYLILDERKRRE